MKKSKILIILIALAIGLTWGVFLIFINATIPVKNTSIDASEIATTSVRLTTIDNVSLEGDWYPPTKQNNQAIILIHQMNKDKSSWNDIAQKLAKQGYYVLAIDLRGHGQSTIQNSDGNNVTLDFKTFSNQEHKNSIADIKAAHNFILDQGISPDNILIIGASIGANLALQFTTENPSIKKSILLSPGLDYSGIKTDELITKLRENQKILMIASQGDIYSANTVKELQELKPNQINSIILPGNSSHGTDMFLGNDSLLDDIINWINNEI